jgi:hypothetical protein
VVFEHRRAPFIVRVVVVKWRGESVKVINVAEDMTIANVKAELADCTGVDTSHQKLLYKGKLLKVCT